MDTKVDTPKEATDDRVAPKSAVAERYLRPPNSSEGKDQEDCEAAERGAAILDEVSEYLFDLFDANCMDEFKRLEEIDNRATVLFDGSGEGSCVERISRSLREPHSLP